VKLVWGKAAIRDLDEIAIHISEDSLQVAELVEKRIHREAQLLVRYPRSGRVGRVAGTGERVVGKTPFIPAYRIASGTVRALRVYRGARKWPTQI
jgi:plasmid stabilization system protein ParE